MPAFPPMAPTLRSVRSTNHISTMSLKFGVPNHVVELLPVSPFLLSPQSAGLDQTRSPFFVESSPTNNDSSLSDSRSVSSLSTSPVTASPLRHSVLPDEEVSLDVQDHRESQLALNEVRKFSNSQSPSSLSDTCAKVISSC